MLTDTLALRDTAVWGEFLEPAPIPHVYGKINVTPIQYSASGLVWVVADHAIIGVDSVTVDGKAATFAWRNAADSSGSTVSFIDLLAPPQETISAEVRGKPSPLTGVLLENAAVIAHDVLTTLGSESTTLADVDVFRTAMQPVKFAGIIEDAERTVRAQIDELMISAGAVWSLGMPGIATRWPVDSVPAGTPIWLTLDNLSARNAFGQVLGSRLYTAVRVLYAWDSANARHGKSAEIDAPDQIAKYGRIEFELDARWLRQDKDAIELGERWLKYWSRPVHTVAFDIDSRAAEIPPGGYVSISHAHCALTGTQFVTDSQVEIGNGDTRLEIEGAYGTAPFTTLVRLGTTFDAEGLEFFLETAFGGVTITTVAFATVTMDGRTIVTGTSGQAFFANVAPGEYTVVITAPGFDTLTTTVTVS